MLDIEGRSVLQADRHMGEIILIEDLDTIQATSSVGNL